MRSHKHDTIHNLWGQGGEQTTGALFVLWIAVGHCTPLFNHQSPECVVRPSTEWAKKLPYSPSHPSKSPCKKTSEFTEFPEIFRIHPCPLAPLTPLRWTVDESHLLPWFCHGPADLSVDLKLLLFHSFNFEHIWTESSACSQWHNARTRQFFSPDDHDMSWCCTPD